jgi:hypothetical protein
MNRVKFPNQLSNGLNNKVMGGLPEPTLIRLPELHTQQNEPEKEQEQFSFLDEFLHKDWKNQYFRLTTDKK